MPQIRHTRFLRLAALLGPVAALVCAPIASARSSAAVVAPAEIDRAVAAFTGAAIGETGGARAPADRRLRLAACAAPLTTSWHGTTRAAVKVECLQTHGSSGPWRIFVATRAASTNSAYSAGARGRSLPAPRAPVIKRGDPITVSVRGRGFTVQQPGEAMENGAIGDWISVRTTREAQPVRARIERPGLAIIPVG
ncbi:MAG: flagella basal body P-ring formation protein FlgA [Pseudomonadota bacterium]